MVLFTRFIKATEEDSRIGATHISLYMALLFYWNRDQKNPFIINRQEIMSLAKIHSRHTYNVCMSQLHDYGYIRYYPSFNPLRGSEVLLLK